MAIALRLLKEFWLPAVIAVGWTIYSLSAGDSLATFTGIVNVFGPSFFLASWATAQFFRVKKQTHMDKNITEIGTRLETVASRLEKLANDFVGYSTGADSIATFLPMFTSNDVFELGLVNMSSYPVFDVHAELIDLDEKTDPERGKFGPRHRFVLASIYPSRIAMSAYRFDMRGRERLRINVFIQTRSQGATQQFRIVRKGDWWSLARKTTVGNNTVQVEVPEDFPGYDPKSPETVFA